jgi:hypothetical protein
MKYTHVHVRLENVELYRGWKIWFNGGWGVHRKKKVREFPVPRRDVTTILSLGGNNDVITVLFLPRGSLISDIPAGDGKLVNLFLRCRVFPVG